MEHVTKGRPDDHGANRPPGDAWAGASTCQGRTPRCRRREGSPLPKTISGAPSRGYGSGLAISRRDASGGINVAVHKKPKPELGDVYRVTPATSPLGDSHGSNRRPAGVVELSPHVARTLTRTTHPSRTARSLPSPANPVLGLREGAWTDHKPRPIPLRWFATDECEYLGALDDDEREAMLEFWKATKMLGRA